MPPVTIHSFGAIRTWSAEGMVEQVGAFEGYRGRTKAGIRMGSTLRDVAKAYGEMRPMGAEGMVELPAQPGIGIESTAWAGEAPDLEARVIQIFAHAIEEAL